MLPKESTDDKEKEVKRKKRQMKLEADTDSSLKATKKLTSSIFPDCS
jgi:hypothetical protein